MLARELPLETTSATAGGLWLPFLAEPPEAVARWAGLTLDVLLELAAVDAAADAPTGSTTGVVVREGQLLEAGRPPWSATIPRIELLPTTNPAPGHDRGWQLSVPLVDMGVYLPYLVRRLEAAGGTVTRLPLTALPTRGLVVNCTGLASRALADDASVHPVRGQVIRMTNPGLTTWWMDESDPDDLTYVLPHARHVVIGGTAEPDDWSTTPEPATAERILEQARALVPELRSASVISHRVGLRPSRPALRLETVVGAEGTVVHCYGHGGSGVTTSWGCADDVLIEVEKVA